jgi:uncharacterized protein YfaS (alpha-2-macroglobulin family)
LSGEDHSPTDPLTIVNQGADPVDAVVTTIAAPAQPLSAGGTGFLINRSYYTLDGQPASISSGAAERALPGGAADARSQCLAVAGGGHRSAARGLRHRQSAACRQCRTGNFPWLGEVSASHAEFRSDRFMAAFDRGATSNRDFVAAYVVRAVTPGIYNHPAAVVEDMYRPELRGADGDGLHGSARIAMSPRRHVKRMAAGRHRAGCPHAPDRSCRLHA